MGAPLVFAAMEEAAGQGISPRDWYYALLDYGASLKRSRPNPSRRSAHHARQGRFEGSRRQKRAWLLREVMARPGLPAEEYAEALAAAERDAGRDAPEPGEAASVLGDLEREGFLAREGECWSVRG